MLHRRILASAFVSAIAAAACGLDTGGTADATGDLGDAGALDGALGDALGNGDVAANDAATFDAAPLDAKTNDAPTACSPGTTTCFALPSGWNVVAYGTQAATCPAPFGAQTDVQEGPTPNGACRCDPCGVTAQPSCTSGQLSTAYGLDGLRTCLIPGATLANGVGGGCNAAQIGIATDARIDPAAPTGGACTSAASKHREAFTFASSGRVCAAPDPASAGCINGVCTPVAPSAPYAICIAAPGVQSACPSGPFGVKHVVGTDVTFDCAACGCTVTAQCSGTVTFYTDPNCRDNGVPVVADGTCHTTPMHMGGNYGSYEYRATPSNVGCTAGAASPASNVQLVGATTVCCAH